MGTKCENLVKRLKSILEKNKVAKKGYAQAAENIRSEALKRFFKEKSYGCEIFNNALQRSLVWNYEEIETDSSYNSYKPGSWFDVRSFFLGNEDGAMLEEAEKADNAAVREYNEVLKDISLPPGIEKLIRMERTRLETELQKVQRRKDLR